MRQLKVGRMRWCICEYHPPTDGRKPNTEKGKGKRERELTLSLRVFLCYRQTCCRYELSISTKHQKMGLGRILVEGVEELGRKAGMKKVVLTCLKSAFISLSLSFHA